MATATRSSSLDARELDLADLLPLLADASRRADADDAFVREGVDALAGRGFLEALVPPELSGPGVPHSTVCATLRRIARACPSTALCLAMHQHLVSAAVWRWRRDGSTAALLRRVASERLHLVSTGANDWLESSGTLVPTAGGYLLNATKPFASGSSGGDLVVTSARLERAGGTDVLHFAVPLSAAGVTIRPDWRASGMRGTGSNTIEFRDVFVAAASVTLTRDAGKFHPVWNVILTVALPLILSVYVGVAEAAADVAREGARPDDATLATLGEMHNALTAARLATDRMVAICDDLRFAPSLAATNEVLACRTIAGREAVRSVDLAVAAVGGRAYFRSHPLERLARDVRAAAFHPVQEAKQVRMSGRLLLGLDPVG